MDFKFSFLNVSSLFIFLVIIRPECFSSGDGSSKGGVTIGENSSRVDVNRTTYDSSKAQHLFFRSRQVEPSFHWHIDLKPHPCAISDPKDTQILSEITDKTLEDWKIEISIDGQNDFKYEQRAVKYIDVDIMRSVVTLPLLRCRCKRVEDVEPVKFSVPPSREDSVNCLGCVTESAKILQSMFKKEPPQLRSEHICVDAADGQQYVYFSPGMDGVNSFVLFRKYLAEKTFSDYFQVYAYLNLDPTLSPLEGEEQVQSVEPDANQGQQVESVP